MLPFTQVPIRLMIRGREHDVEEKEKKKKKGKADLS
jgi:hypothetical protein